MSDLCERLRASSTINDDVYALRHEAADEIASLRAQLAMSQASSKKWEDAFEVESARLASARKALEEGRSGFETIRLVLINHLRAPERTAFWRAVQGRDDADAYLAALTDEQRCEPIESNPPSFDGTTYGDAFQSDCRMPARDKP